MMNGQHICKPHSITVLLPPSATGHIDLRLSEQSTYTVPLTAGASGDTVGMLFTSSFSYCPDEADAFIFLNFV